MLVYAIDLTTRFRRITVREGMLVEGPAGWGEFCPFTEYGDAESAPWLAAAVEAAAEGWPEPVRDQVPVNAIVPAVPPEQAHALVTASGCGTAKVKVAEPGLDPAGSLAADVARVRAVREVLGPDGRIRVDANAGWSLRAALTALTALGESGLEYAEQPCSTLAEMAALRRELARAGTPVLLAADGSATELPPGSKGVLAHAVWDAVVQRLD